jgi:hypothetical protein
MKIPLSGSTDFVGAAFFSYTRAYPKKLLDHGFLFSAPLLYQALQKALHPLFSKK